MFVVIWIDQNSRMFEEMNSLAMKYLSFIDLIFHFLYSAMEMKYLSFIDLIFHFLYFAMEMN